MRQVLLAVPLLATVASAAVIADYRFLPTSPGTWKPWAFYAYGDNRRALGARPADVKEVEAQLLRLNAIIKKTDGFTSPVGFSIETAGNLSPVSNRFDAIPGEPAMTVRPIPSSLGFGAPPVMEYGSGATAKRVDTGEVEHLWFYVNDVPQPMGGSNSSVTEFEKLDVNVVRLARPQPDVFALPRYGDTVVLKKSAAPIWAVVTLGETLELV